MLTISKNVPSFHYMSWL